MSAFAATAMSATDYVLDLSKPAYPEVINFILGQKPIGYNPVAVDVNGDGIVDVSDVTLLINLILK